MPPLLVALLTAPVTFAGGSILPWHPEMVDLDVYRRAGDTVLVGGDLYAHTDGLPFLYPPAAALLSVPLALVGQTASQLCWLVLCVTALLAILYRLGLSGWPLSLVTTAAVYFCEPVNQTLAYGQLGTVLVALVMIDLVPGPSLVPETLKVRLPERLRLHTGVLTGVATSIKLTPALFALYLLGAGGNRVPDDPRRSATRVGTAVLAVAALAAIALPAASAHYWSHLARGDIGLRDQDQDIVYLTNQSVLGTWLRVFGIGGTQTATGLIMAAMVGGFGAYAAARWHRRGKVAFAVTVCGVAGVLASPVAWSHHFVWVVPLAVVLLDAGLPTATRIAGWIFVGWVTAAPFHRLPLGDAVELTYNGWQQTIASFTAISGVAFLALTLASTMIVNGDTIADTQSADRAPNPLLPGNPRSHLATPQPRPSQGLPGDRG